MNKLLTIPLLNNKQDLTQNLNLLFPIIPFYGLSGTIYSIEEAEESYYKIIYNQDGTINKNKLPISKKKGKNYNLLLDDYYKEVKKYLDKYETKYKESENTKYKEILTNKQYYFLTMITAIASIAAIPFLFTTTFIGLLFETISLLSLYIVNDIHKKDIQAISEQNTFKKQYQELKRDLVNYTTGSSITKTKKNETTFTKIDNLDKSHHKSFPNIKLLTKDEYKEAA